MRSEEKAYYTVGILLDSETYRDLMKDAQQTGLKPTALIPVRLADYYRAIRLGIALPTSGSSTKEEAVVEPLSLDNAEKAANAWEL